MITPPRFHIAQINDLGQRDGLLVGHHRQGLQGLDRQPRGRGGVEQHQRFQAGPNFGGREDGSFVARRHCCVFGLRLVGHFFLSQASARYLTTRSRTSHRPLASATALVLLWAELYLLHARGGCSPRASVVMFVLRRET